ncbi:MAG: hypothetical protein ACLRYB_14745 [Segatella copri]
MVLGKIRKIALIPKFIPIFGVTIPKNIQNFGIRAIFQRFHLSSSPISWGQFLLEYLSSSELVEEGYATWLFQSSALEGPSKNMVSSALSLSVIPGTNIHITTWEQRLKTK